jgi:hypothetical protein
MMIGMGHPRLRARLRAGRRLAGALVAAALVLAACTTGNPPDEPEAPQREDAALRVRTVYGADRLDERTRSEIEGAVAKVLSDYVVEAFLGPFPREEFVSSFDSFTSGIAGKATRHIDLLTASSAADATAVHATELDARLSFLTRAGTVYAGTADVHFAFEATMEDGSTRPLVLDGRIMLDAGGEKWRIFGYDVRFDDGVPVDAETEPEEGS